MCALHCKSTSVVLLIYLIIAVALQNVYTESLSTTNRRIRRQSDGASITCELPAFPTNGKWIVLNGDGKPGDMIVQNSVVKYECDPQYKLSSFPLFVCDANWSQSSFPVCEKKCSAKYSTSTTTLKCDDRYGHDVACNEAVDGTFLSYTCIPFYETPFGYRKTAICEEGEWNLANPICQPVCGKKIDNDAIKLVYRGKINEKREYPWIVALFQRSFSDLAICGGSIISENVVITAAHCVTNDFGNALPATEFTVGVGKYYTKFQDPRDQNVQYIDIDRIVVMPEFTGAAKRFLADIALLITTELIVFSEVIQPVCYQDLQSIHIHPGKSGVVAGWGKTETGEQPDELRTLEIPYKYEATCVQELPMEWADKFYTNDKICTGFFNQSKSLCPGDSGSGLYFLNPENNRYYIHGVVSVGPAVNGECDPQQNSLYTKVANYYNFIDRVVVKGAVERCTLPAFPEHGKWSISERNKKPGEVVSSNTILKVECDQNYILSSTSSFTDCRSARTLPKCELSCPKLSFPGKTTYKCTNIKGDPIDCTLAIDGTKLSTSCPTENKLNATSIHICKSGSWKSIQECTVTKNTNINNIAITGKYVMCTYSGWYSYDKDATEDFNVTLCTHIIYSDVGAWNKEDNKLVQVFHRHEKNLSQIITGLKKRNNNLRVLLSLGDIIAQGSFPSGVPSTKNERTSFIFNMLDFIEENNFDGLNMVWDYSPQALSITAETEKANYIRLLQGLSKKFIENVLILTATVEPYSNDAGYYAKELIELLDFVIIRTTEFYNPQSYYTGHNSPLYPSSLENDWEKDNLNIHAAANNLIDKGFERSKIVLTVALYTWTLFLKDKNNHGVHVPVTNKKLSELDAYKSVSYDKICANKNWTSVWDYEQSSVYSYFEDKWIGHENKESVRAKAAYIKENGFLGINVRPIDGDDVYGHCGPKQILLKQINRVLRDNLVIKD